MKIAAPIIITYEENLTASVYHHYIGFMSKLLYIGSFPLTQAPVTRTPTSFTR